MGKEYKDTLNLPKTKFSMKANLPVREPEFVKKWAENKIYKKIIEKNKNKKSFVLHDGPPYANGHIHFGHILNKVLKDIVVKYRNMSGSFTEFIPGWDCHGLPIEIQVEKKIGKKEQAEISEVRKKCRQYALKHVEIQKDEFKRIGVLGDWENPYLTLNSGYEGTIARELGKFVKEGYIYRGKKPVYWCASCQTALAEAEVEYMDHTSPSIYVKFKLDDKDLENKISTDGLPLYAVIWTTTPWTVPSNLAIALNPSFKYNLVKVDGEVWIIADMLLENMMKEIGKDNYEVSGEVDPVTIEKAKFKHPLIDRDSILILGEHVTMEAGTGCVHTAPGHGREDFDIGRKYNLPAFAPIDDKGKFTKEVGLPYLEGIYVEKANSIINDKLNEVNSLVWKGDVSHSYPHCWRCKKPIVFRSTAQWFISMEKNDLRKRSLEAIDKVEWIPKWGRERIYGMVENRPDWCISRQRAWGVPIIALKCRKCDEDILSSELIDHVAALFDKEGSDIWFDKPVEELIPEDFKCPGCGESEFVKEHNIIDVWFESGVSYAAVIERENRGEVPVDLYLEGSDQHRGWFHSALLSGVATRDTSPYKSCLTHGFVVDAKGKKYSKSTGNYIPPKNILNRQGAEILRLWVAAEDYRNDIRFSEEIVKRLTEGYRKIRNTCRFILGNLYDFLPKESEIEYDEMQEIDHWILHRLSLLIDKCRNAYKDYQFHVIYHAINEFCVVDLSSFYLDIIKDRLYCEKTDGRLRRSAQTAIWKVLGGLTKVMAPILSFTSEDVWEHMPDEKNKEESIFLTDIPSVDESLENKELAEKWNRFRTIRSEVTKLLERARADKKIGNSLEAKLVIDANEDLNEFLNSFETSLADLFIVSGVEFGQVEGVYRYESEEVPGLKMGVERVDFEKCERCWKYEKDIGKNPDHPTICKRCTEAIS